MPQHPCRHCGSLLLLPERLPLTARQFRAVCQGNSNAVLQIELQEIWEV